MNTERKSCKPRWIELGVHKSSMGVGRGWASVKLSGPGELQGRAGTEAVAALLAHSPYQVASITCNQIARLCILY